jgi:hypothetical protein
VRAALQTIPVVDVREGGAVRHAREGRDRALALRRELVGRMPVAALAPLMPLLDRITRRWLLRSQAPYIHEIEDITAALGVSGLWFLNGCYQWGCTALAREEGDAPWLVRTLDWPFHGIGRHVEVARTRGPAGEFFSATWPGYVGVLTAVAPGRFAATLNQGPLYRRSQAAALRLFDLAANAVNTWRNIHYMPPDQLLRQVFETCNSFSEARALLERVRIARPAIFTLAGCTAGERCVVERTEEAHATRTDVTCAANDWLEATSEWEGRMGGISSLWQSFAEAARNSRRRTDTLAGWNGAADSADFAWVTPPVLNPYTRQAVEMCAAKGVLRVVGYEQSHGAALPEPATLPCALDVLRITA